MDRADALHIALTHIVLEGGDLNQIAAELARELDTGVLFTSTDGREWGSSLDDALRKQLDEVGLCELGGRFKVEMCGKQGVRIGKGRAHLVRVVAGGADLGRLIAISPTRDLTGNDLRAMERAATVAALLITRQQAITAVENKYQGDFLRDIFLDRAGDADFITEHAAFYGWDLSRPMVVVAAEIDPQPADEDPLTHQQQRMFQERFSAAWRQVAPRVADGAPCVDFSTEVVTVLPVNDQPSGTTLVNELVTGVAGDRGGGRRSFTVGVSRLVPTLEDLPEAYAQARRAREVGRRIHGTGSTTWFDQLGLHRLIALVPDPEELRAFATDVLGDLAANSQDALDLRETLQVLLDTNFNVAEAARLQYFHYNTMRYRVGKLERMLGPVASDPNLRLDIAVALKVLEILH